MNKTSAFMHFTTNSYWIVVKQFNQNCNQTLNMQRKIPEIAIYSMEDSLNAHDIRSQSDRGSNIVRALKNVPELHY